MQFIIIASARTGSSHLVNMLGAHPEIFCNGNVYHPRQVWVFWPEAKNNRTLRNELLQLRKEDPAGLAQRVFDTNFGRPHVGFKIFDRQHDQILEKLIADSAVRKIILYRRNVLANFSSKQAAKKTGKFGVKEGERVPETPKVRFVEHKFIEFLNEYNSFYRRVIDSLNREQQPFHWINYEEVNDPHIFSGLISFIGADPALNVSASEQRKKQVKQNSTDICSRFQNREDVLRFLEARGLQHWAHEGETSLGDLELAAGLPDLDSSEESRDSRHIREVSRRNSATS
jgi:hypothetical protein